MCFSVVYTESHALAPLTYQNQTHKVIQLSSLKSDLCSQYGHLVDTLCASLPVDRPSEKEIELTDNESLRQEVIRARYKVWSDLFQLTNIKYILIIVHHIRYVLCLFSLLKLLENISKVKNHPDTPQMTATMGTYPL